MIHFRFILKHWAIFIIIIFSSLGISLLAGLSISFIFPLLYDGPISKQGNIHIPFPFDQLLLAFAGISLPEKIRIIAVLLVIIYTAKSLLQYINLVASSRILIISTKHFRALCYNQMMNVGMGYFNSRKTGYFYSICDGFCNNIGMFTLFVLSAIPQLFNMVIFLIMGMILSWKMVLFTIALAGLISMSLKRLMKKTEISGKEYSKAYTRFSSVAIELILAMKVIRIFAQEKNQLEKIENEIDLYNQTQYRLTVLRGSAGPFYESMAVTALACLLIAGSYLLIGPNSIGLPGLVAFIVMFQRISGEANAINQKRVQIMGDLPSYREVFSFLRPDGKQRMKNGTLTFSKMKKGIEMKNMTFGYNHKESIVLRNVSCYIPRGAKVGVAGASGGGKSTLTELLLRFYDPQEGQVLVDGSDLKELDIASWRKKIGIVSQDVFLFNDSIAANISFGKPCATKEEIEQAARKAHAHEFIQEMTRGYDTLVGDRGVRLSGGQKQRIAIARAIIIDPEILIFDEATSALDTESERIVQKALDDVARGRTVLTIAHRLSTIAHYDNILVMDSGQIVEQGRHEELLQKGGIYKKLVEMQDLKDINLPTRNGEEPKQL